MRFGRKSKHRLRTGVVINHETRANQAGTVASEERNALLDSTPDPQSDAQPVDGFSGVETGDPTQLLLTALGGFQRQLANAGAEAGTGLWADASMDCLVTGVEVAVRQGWSDVIEALTETGRVLQTYENAGRVVECLPFLNDAYEILCLMVGDLIVDDIRSGVREKWRRRYEQVLEEVQAAGLELIEDGDEGEGARAGPPDAAPAFEGVMDTPSEIPFDLPPANLTPLADSAEAGPVPHEPGLPTLDELPPLAEADEVASGPAASVLETVHEDDAAEGPDEEGLTGAEAGVFGSVSYLDLSAESEPEGQQDGSGPAGAPESDATTLTQLAVDVLDRLSEQFSAVENAAGDERGYFVVRISGGVSTLLREAEKAGNQRARDLCAAMAEACQVAGEKEHFINASLVDLGFGFCAAYPEAFAGEPVENQIDWVQECRQTLSRWESGEETDTEEPAVRDDAVVEESPLIEITPEPEVLGGAEPIVSETGTTEAPFPAIEMPDESKGATAEDAQEALGLDLAKEEERPAEAPDELGQEDTGEETVEAEPAGPAPSEMTSAELLLAAQDAAARDDSESAKYYALLAAAAIARDESLRADRALVESEGRLKDSLDAADTARQAVQNAEQDVTKAATEVSSIKSELGAVKERRAHVEQKREDMQEKIADVEERIARLEAERNGLRGELDEIETEMREAQVEETKTHERVDRLEEDEEGERRKLEIARQDAKDLLNSGTELEGAVEKARQDLEREKSALSGIEQTVRDTCSKADPESDSDSMLF